jgi:hypothetical protein
MSILLPEESLSFAGAPFLLSTIWEEDIHTCSVERGRAARVSRV